MDKKLSLTKSILWRLTGIIWLLILSRSIQITFLHHSVFLIIYFFHERFWLKIASMKKYWLKPVTYEIVLAIPILTLISFYYTGNLSWAVILSVTYTTSKLVLYYGFDRFYDKLILRQIATNSIQKG